MGENLMPRISVIMPVYNCREFIEESSGSIFNQTYTNFEFLIIDDCSTDGTYEYLKSLTDPRMNLIRKPQNSGYTVSLNMGLELAKGEYIARMDGDDISLPDRFEKQIAFMDQNPDVVVCGGAYKAIGSDFIFIPNTSPQDIMLDLLSRTPIAHPTAVIRSSTLKKHNVQYNTGYEPAEDYKLWTILSEYGRLSNITDIVLHYRIHQNQTTKLRGKSQKDIGIIISSEYINKLCKNNVNVNFFCNSALNSIDDFVKYESVETDLKNAFVLKGFKTNDKYFHDRKKECLRQTLTPLRYSIKLAFKDFKLVIRYWELLDNKFIVRYLGKSLIYWKATN
jgi:glycosyltransferase involved in cell wall biosynthesis